MQNKQEKKSLIEECAIVSPQGKPNAALLEVLKVLELLHDGTLNSIVAITQKKFLQTSPDGQRRERWELEEIMPEFRKKLMPHLDKLGMVDEIPPSKEKYDGVFMLGELVLGVRERLSYLSRLWEKGTRFDKIIFLGGERPLMDSGRETPKTLLDRNNKELPIREDWLPPNALPTTEFGMMKLVWDQAKLPQGLKEVKVEFVNAPLIYNPKTGRVDRPTTKDTIEKWLETNPREGKFLAISNNPYIGYQHSVLKTYLPRGFQVETVGPKAPLNLPLSFYLGEMARWLYQEKLRLFEP